MPRPHQQRPPSALALLPRDFAIGALLLGLAFLYVQSDMLFPKLSSLIRIWPTRHSLSQKFTTASNNITSIRVRHQADFDQLYPLILDYARNPERAASVTRFSFQVANRHRNHGSLGTGHEPNGEARDVSSETDLFKAIEPLDLSAEEQTRWVRTLSWMKPESIAERKAATEPRSYTYKYAWNDHAFALHASTVLLLLCPNIEDFVYEDNYHYPNPVFETLKRNNYGQLPAQHLQRLKRVRVLPTNDLLINDERFYTAMNFLGTWRMFHRLPAIEQVSVDAIEDDYAGDRMLNFPAGTANFTKIHVGHSMFASDMIAAIIRAPKDLKQLTMSTGGRSSRDGGFSQVFPKTIGKALACQKATLQSLDLDLDEHIQFPTQNEPEDEDMPIDEEERAWSIENYEFDPLEEYYEGFEEQDRREMKLPLLPFDLTNDRPYGATIGSLHDFSALTNLSIGVQLLLSPRPQMRRRVTPVTEAPFRLIDALPTTLEYLRIRGYIKGEDEHFDSQIEELMRLREERLPRLKTIEGVDECIASGKSVGDPDNNEKLLWLPPRHERHPMWEHDDENEEEAEVQDEQISVPRR